MLYESDYQKFLSWFKSYAVDKLAHWSMEYKLNPPTVHVISEGKLDPWFVGSVYVPEGFRHSGVVGPAIIFNDEYVRELYYNAKNKGMLYMLKDYLTWTLAHGFGHHVRSHVRPIIRTVMHIEESVVVDQMFASIVAFRLTGMTRLDHLVHFRMIMGESVHSYIRRKHAERGYGYK